MGYYNVKTVHKIKEALLCVGFIEINMYTRFVKMAKPKKRLETNLRSAIFLPADRVEGTSQGDRAVSSIEFGRLKSCYDSGVYRNDILHSK